MRARYRTAQRSFAHEPPMLVGSDMLKGFDVNRETMEVLPTDTSPTTTTCKHDRPAMSPIGGMCAETQPYLALENYDAACAAPAARASPGTRTRTRTSGTAAHTTAWYRCAGLLNAATPQVLGGQQGRPVVSACVVRTASVPHVAAAARSIRV